MPSTFTWLDYSETERRKMLDVINLFKEKETRDELGIGSIRDAFADIFFPGTSTIQTRARYFLFIPWIYRRLEEQRLNSTLIEREARKLEIELIFGLLAGGETEGVIGERARATLQRLPSSVYWQGLGVWGIRLVPGSIDQYHRSLDHFQRLTHGQRISRTRDDDPIEELPPSNWHPRLPAAPAEFPRRVTFSLEPAEAEYLTERVKLSRPSSLLAFLTDAGYAVPNSSFIWEHPELALFPAMFREQIEHARNFSETINGAALLYNLMLAELVRNDDRIDEYDERIALWADRLAARESELTHWDRRRFWEIVYAGGANVTMSTRRFVDTWLDAVCPPQTAANVADDPQLRALITNRERQLKRRLARLDNARARELWSGAAGTGQLDYRWFRARQLLRDLQLGQQRGTANA